jgi:hypothetical protein
VTKYTGFDVSFRATALSAAVDLQLSTIFSASLVNNSNAFALLFDAVMQTDFVQAQQLASGFRYLKRKGTGLRLAIQMVSSDTDIKLNVSAVAAQTKLGLATSMYKIEGIGVSADVIAASLDLPISGAFDDGTFSKMRSVIADKLPAYLESPDIGVGDYSVPLPSLQDDPATQARGICYAAVMVAQLRKLSYALAHRPPELAPEAVLVGYARFATADLEKDTPPTAQQADAAARWFATGSTQP